MSAAKGSRELITRLGYNFNVLSDHDTGLKAVCHLTPSELVW